MADTMPKGKEAVKMRNLMAKLKAEELEEVHNKNELSTPKSVSDSPMYHEYNMAIINLPTIDIESPAQLRKRCNEYFEMTYRYGLKPCVSQLANALGISTPKLRNIKNGLNKTFPVKARAVIEKYYNLIEGASENLAQDGKISPVYWIFSAKNNFGMRDQVEVIATNNQVRETSADDLIKEAELLENGNIETEGKVE